MVPQAEVDPSTFTGTSIITENKSIAHERLLIQHLTKMLSSAKIKKS